MILIADDNEGVRSMLKSLLDDIDEDLIECSNGREAIELYELHLPDVVLMDLNMQPIDGVTATRTILERFPDARVVIVTQHQDRRTRDLCLSIGACGFVGKDDLTALPDIVRSNK